mgnify:CR=1 FL=1
MESSDIQLVKNEDGVILSHAGTFTFSAGSKQLKDDSKVMIAKYIEIINSFTDQNLKKGS